MSDAASTTGPGEAAGETQRAVPFHCPFCAGEDLRPVESGAVPGLTRGGWHCRSCLRVFTVAFHGLHDPFVLSAAPSLSGSEPR